MTVSTSAPSDQDIDLAVMRTIQAVPSAETELPQLVGRPRLDRAAPRAVVEGCRGALARATASHIASIGVTSALPGEGRSTVALGMALVMQRDFRRKTLLVELDVERPSMATRLGLPPGPGIAEQLRDEATIDECIVAVDENLFLLRAGDAADQPGRFYTELVCSDYLRQLQLWCEVIVADLPPILTVGASSQIASHFAALMLVVRAGSTPAPRVEEAIADLPSQPTLLLNGVESGLPRWLRRFTRS